jgi:hypothetical protein
VLGVGRDRLLAAILEIGGVDQRLRDVVVAVVDGVLGEPLNRVAPLRPRFAGPAGRPVAGKAAVAKESLESFKRPV